MKFQYKYSMDKTLTQLFLEAVNKYPDNIIYKYRDADSNWLDITYRDFLIKVKKFAGGLIELGLDKKHMAIVCDNSPEWAISVIANMGLGGVDIPRGLNTPDSELSYILENSDVDFICIQNSFASSQINKYNIGEFNLIKNMPTILGVVISFKNDKHRINHKIKKTYRVNSTAEFPNEQIRLSKISSNIYYDIERYLANIFIKNTIETNKNKNIRKNGGRK